jgi:hypothetical protein
MIMIIIILFQGVHSVHSFYLGKGEFEDRHRHKATGLFTQVPEGHSPDFETEVYSLPLQVP